MRRVSQLHLLWSTAPLWKLTVETASLATAIVVVAWFFPPSPPAPTLPPTSTLSTAPGTYSSQLPTVAVPVSTMPPAAPAAVPPTAAPVQTQLPSAALPPVVRPVAPVQDRAKPARALVDPSILTDNSQDRRDHGVMIGDSNPFKPRPLVPSQ